MPSIIRRALDQGAHDYWTKPLDYRKTIGMLKKLLCGCWHGLKCSQLI